MCYSHGMNKTQANARAKQIDKLAFRLYQDHMAMHGAPATDATWAALDERARRTYQFRAKRIHAAFVSDGKLSL